MDSYETLNGCGSEFDRLSKFGKLDNLKYDQCDIEADCKRSMKTLKYYTQNFFDKDIIQNRGIFFNDGFGIPACEIDQSTAFREGKNTNLNLLQNLPALPLPTTASFVKGQGDVLVEQDLRSNTTFRDRKTCKPRDNEYYQRSFYIFDNMPIRPNGCWENVVQRSNGLRGGVDTRRANSKNYRQRKDC